MRYLKWTWLLVIWLAWAPTLSAGGGKILKVLPHYLDKQGRHALSPSLYERDAYQVQLRKNPAMRSGIRFDIHWKASKARNKQLKLKLELRTSKTGSAKANQYEQTVTPRWYGSRWSAISIQGDAYPELGEILAWRVTLYDQGRQIAEQRSFLW